MAEIIIHEGTVIETVKVTELPLAESFDGLVTLGVDNENRSVRVSLQEVGEATDAANQAAQTALSAIQHLLPDIDVRFWRGNLYAIVRTPNYDMWEQYKDSMYWGMEFSKVGRKTNNEDTDIGPGRKFRLMNDKYTNYTPINKGDLIPGPSLRHGYVFWTSQKILPQPVPEGLIIDWQQFPYTPKQCLDRLVYFVDSDNRLSDVETALTKSPEEAARMMWIPGRNKKRGYVLTDTDGTAHINFTRRCRLTLFMYVDLVDAQGNTHRRRISKSSREFRIVLGTHRYKKDGPWIKELYYAFKEQTHITHAFK